MGVNGVLYDVYIVHGGCNNCMDLSGSGAITSDCWGSRFLGLKDDPRLVDING